MTAFLLCVYFIIGTVCALAEAKEIGKGATFLGVVLAFAIWPVYLICALYDIAGRDE